VLVVSDTSPLRALQSIHLVGLLASLYERVLIPPAVRDELLVERRRVPVFPLAEHGFIEVRSPTDPRAFPGLDRGESEAIALALELHVTTILVDETMGRRAAAKNGLTPVGALGVLLEAKQRGLVERVAPLLDRLKGEGFRVSETVRRAVLERAGEV
jgi:predicted nucleic acid-binding protein